MCGIFGYVGNVKLEKQKFYNLISAIACTSEVRGTDSTGYAARFRDGSIEVDKMPVPASTFRWMSPGFLGLQSRLPRALIGHTRYGTGSSPLINNNNHPFLGSRYHMVHNGTIPSWRDVKKDHELEMTSETDSEVILRCFEKCLSDGMDEVAAIDWTLNNIWGNMAVALLNHHENSIWLFRNENPIWVAEFPDEMWGGKVLVFCSTDDIFKWSWKRAYNVDMPATVNLVQLDSNTAYRLSTVPVFLDGQPWHITKQAIDVKKKFYKSKVYTYGEYAYNDTWYKRSSSASNEKFFSGFDPWKPEDGFSLSPGDVTKISKLMADKKDFSIDGLTDKELIALNTFVREITGEEASGDRFSSPNHENALL